MLISYIIPMFNGGAYIGRCIESILNQGFTPPNYEIIVINDGSTDNGPEIVNRYAQAHDNIKLINQENQGVGAARNRGIAEAKGEYIHFIDADDALIEGGSALLFETAFGKGYRPDLIVFNLHYIVKRNENDSLPPLTSNIYFEGTLSDFIRQCGIKPYCTSFFFKTQIIKDLKFNNFKIGEDLCFMLDVYDKVNSTTIAFDTKLYMYFCHDSSAVHSVSKSAVKELAENYICLYTAVCQGKYLKQFNLSKRRLLVHQVINYVVFINILSVPFTLKDTKDILQKCSQVGLFEFEGLQGKFYRLIRLIARHPHLMWGISPLYRHIYIPYFKKS